MTRRFLRTVLLPDTQKDTRTRSYQRIRLCTDIHQRRKSLRQSRTQCRTLKLHMCCQCIRMRIRRCPPHKFHVNHSQRRRTVVHCRQSAGQRARKMTFTVAPKTLKCGHRGACEHEVECYLAIVTTVAIVARANSVFACALVTAVHVGARTISA